MSRGIVIFGMNNERVNYVQLAVLSARFIKKNMPGTDICLITDQASLDHSDVNLVNRTFTHVKIVSQLDEQFTNTRQYKDTRYYHFDAKFRNESRSLVYELSPFDETLLIDCDFLVGNNVLSCVWGSDEEIMMNKKACSLLHEPLTGPEFRLNPFGVKMYWATVIYFKKGEKAKALFDLVEHIKDNWDFYRLVYDFSGHLFRNDFAFSIAIHMLNGFVESDGYAAPLPEDCILTATDHDQLYSINGKSDFSFFVNDPKENWKFYLTRLKNLNVHCMNKISLINLANKALEVTE